MLNHVSKSSRILFLLVCILLPYGLFSQDFLPRLDAGKFLQKDSDNFYFKEIWITSKDVNSNDAQGYLRRATDKIELGYYSEALSDIDKSLKIDSALSYCYYLKGFIMMKKDSLNEALSDFRKAIRLNDKNVYNYYFSAEIYIFQQKIHEADSMYTRAIIEDDKFYNAHFGLANIHAFRGEFEKAEFQYKKVIELKPDFTFAYFNLALLYSTKDPVTAIKYLNKTIDVNPSFAPAYFMRGSIRLRQDKLSYTLKDWSKAIELDSLNQLFRISRGFLYIENNKYQEAIKELTGVVKATGMKNFIGDFEKSGKTRIANDFLSQVVTYYRYANRLSENENNELADALCSFCLEKFDRADIIYNKLLPATSSAGLIQYLKGFSQEYQLNFKMAETFYLQAIAEKEFPDEAYLRLGIVSNDLGRYPAAINNLNRYISSNNSIKLAYRSRAMSYVKVSKIDSAISDYSNFIKLDSSEQDIYFNRANCYKSIGKYREAIGDYNIVIRNNGRDLESCVLLSECLYESGDTAKAYDYLNMLNRTFRFLTQNGYLLRGSINLYYQKYDSAIIDLTRALFYNESNIDALIYRGLAYYCIQDYRKSGRDLTEAIKLDDTDITALYTRGLVNIKLNELRQAYDDLKKADSMGHPLAKKTIGIYLKNYNPSANP